MEKDFISSKAVLQAKLIFILVFPPSHTLTNEQESKEKQDSHISKN